MTPLRDVVVLFFGSVDGSFDSEAVVVDDESAAVLARLW